MTLIGKSLTVTAGYENNSAIILDGMIAKVERERKRLSRVTRISLGD